MPITVLGLGSNLGDRENNIVRAFEAIGRRYPVIDYSSLYETEPVGYEDQPRFLNMVIRVDSSGSSPEELLRFVKSIERDLGRELTFRWGPRPIDIDILLVDDVVRESGELVVPHRELLNRNFVLVPLSELQDTVIVDGRTVSIRDRIRSNAGPGQGVTFYKRL